MMLPLDEACAPLATFDSGQRSKLTTAEKNFLAFGALKIAHETIFVLGHIFGGSGNLSVPRGGLDLAHDKT